MLHHAAQVVAHSEPQAIGALVKDGRAPASEGSANTRPGGVRHRPSGPRVQDLDDTVGRRAHGGGAPQAPLVQPPRRDGVRRLHQGREGSDRLLRRAAEGVAQLDEDRAVSLYDDRSVRTGHGGGVYHSRAPDVAKKWGAGDSPHGPHGPPPWTRRSWGWLDPSAAQMGTHPPPRAPLPEGRTTARPPSPIPARCYSPAPFLISINSGFSTSHVPYAKRPLVLSGVQAVVTRSRKMVSGRDRSAGSS